MKITKRQLRQIIAESKRKLSEAAERDLYMDLTAEQERALGSLGRAVNFCLDAGCDKADILDTLNAAMVEHEIGSRKPINLPDGRMVQAKGRKR